jgi:phosphoenolpyruvate-protein kinase (PTS system EI component)
MLRDSLAAKDQEFKDLKASLEQDFQRRSSKLIEEHAAILPDDALEKELHECKGKLTDLEKDNFKQKKEL